MQGFVAQIPWRFTVPTPKPRYPKQIKHLGDRIRARRIDLGLLQREAASRIGVTGEAVHNWEGDHAEPEVRFYPALIDFLGYNPLPEPRTLGEAVKRERMNRGWSMARLAKEVGVDSGTVARLERDGVRLARRPVAAITGALAIPLETHGDLPPEKNGSGKVE